MEHQAESPILLERKPYPAAAARLSFQFLPILSRLRPPPIPRIPRPKNTTLYFFMKHTYLYVFIAAAYRADRRGSRAIAVRGTFQETGTTTICNYETPWRAR
jgi:hypothetical protein